MCFIPATLRHSRIDLWPCCVCVNVTVFTSQPRPCLAVWAHVRLRASCGVSVPVCAHVGLPCVLACVRVHVCAGNASCMLSRVHVHMQFLCVLACLCACVLACVPCVRVQGVVPVRAVTCSCAVPMCAGVSACVHMWGSRVCWPVSVQACFWPRWYLSVSSERGGALEVVGSVARRSRTPCQLREAQSLPWRQPNLLPSEWPSPPPSAHSSQGNRSGAPGAGPARGHTRSVPQLMAYCVLCASLCRGGVGGA